MTDDIKNATCLLLSVSFADNKIDQEEINIIKDIIIDFFKINQTEANIIINECIDLLNDATDLYEFGRTLNECFSYKNKVDFICCTFEVAYADKEIHYLENHIIKKIASILNVEHADIVKAKQDIKNYLNIL